MSPGGGRHTRGPALAGLPAEPLRPGASPAAGGGAGAGTVARAGREVATGSLFGTGAKVEGGSQEKGGCLEGGFICLPDGKSVTSPFKTGKGSKASPPTRLDLSS